jgi:hypothetical protein
MKTTHDTEDKDKEWKTTQIDNELKQQELKCTKKDQRYKEQSIYMNHRETLQISKKRKEFYHSLSKLSSLS